MANSPATSYSVFGDPLVIPAYDKLARWELHTKPLFRQFADIRVVDPTHNSNIYSLPMHDFEEVADDRHLLDEVVSPDQVQPTPTKFMQIQIHEYGRTLGRTTFLGDVAYIPVDPVLGRKLSVNMADTLDALVADQLYNGDHIVDGVNVPFTQVVGGDGETGDFSYNPTTDRGSLGAGDTLTSQITARVVARLRTAAAVPQTGAYYIGLMHPDTVVSYQEDTGTLGWQEPKVNVDTGEIYTGSIGAYRGVQWVENPRCRVVAGAGSGDADVYQTLVFGREVLAEHVVREPSVVVSPVLDGLGRHRGIGWYGVLGHAIYRQEPLWRIEHTIESA